MPKKKSSKKPAKKTKKKKAAKAKAKPAKKSAALTVKKAKEKPVKKKKVDFEDEPEDADDDMEVENAHEVDEVGVEPAYDEKNDEY